MYSSYTMTYLKDTKIRDLNTYTYHLPKDVFYNSSVSDNPAFCGISDKCLGNGVHNISKCNGGVSAFISLPHFLNAEEKFAKSVKGIKPVEELHDYVLHFEPVCI